MLLYEILSMLIKLGIIAGIVILGGMIFYNEIGNIFPSTTTVVNDALTDDINSLGTRASDSIQERLDDSIGMAGNAITEGINNTGQQVSGQLHEVGESSKDAVTDVLSSLNPITLIEGALEDTQNYSDTPK